MSARQKVHNAIGQLLKEGEVVIDVALPDGVCYLIHRGGVDGEDRPTIWAILGMLQASADCARDQLRESTEDAE